MPGGRVYEKGSIACVGTEQAPFRSSLIEWSEQFSPVTGERQDRDSHLSERISFSLWWWKCKGGGTGDGLGGTGLGY